MLTTEQHVDNLVRHIRLVQDACLLLGKRLMSDGHAEFGRLLIGRGFVHDASKFQGIEWDYLHAGKTVEKEHLELAIHQHNTTNPHHAEYWPGGFEQMPKLCIAEFACDIFARSMEFGTSVKDWIKNTAIERYQMDVNGERYKWLMSFVEILSENEFVA